MERALPKSLQKKFLAALALILGFGAQNVVAGPDNIAPKAKVTASTELNRQYAASKVTDGIIGVDNLGEWACEGQTTSWGYVRFPWIKLEWEQPQNINKMLLFDRPSRAEHIAGGTLEFSDGSKVTVNSIPNDGTARLVTFAPRKVKWVRFVTVDGKGKDLGFSEIEVYPSHEMYKDYVSWVDPYIETNRGRYFFFITGSLPFGMISSAPYTRNKNQGGGGYNYNESEILGFAQIHDWMMGGLEIMPTPATINPTIGEKPWRSNFSHDDEIVQPGYQRVYLRDHHTWVEQTITERVSFYRFKYTQDMEAQVLTNLGGLVGNIVMKNAAVNKVNDREITGSFSMTERFWGGPLESKVFFVAQFDKPFKSLKGWKGKKQIPGITSLAGDSMGVAAMYTVKAGDTLQMKIAVSYTSVDNARKNLQTDVAHWDFDKVRSDARNTWNDWLGRIDVKGGTQDQRVKFYTDLWHVLLGRHILNDASGNYPDYTQGKRIGNFTDAQLKVRTLPKDKNGKARYNMYNSDAFWLSQWNLNVLWGLAWPSVQDDMSASLIQYADNGGLLPRGPSAGGYSYIMTSCPATNLVISTYMKGMLTKAEPKHAYEVIKRNHLPGGMMGAPEDIEFYTKKGWWPGNAGITVEVTFQDWALAQMAKKLGKKKDATFFLNRSKGWEHLFNEDQKLLFPKDKEGNWMHLEPLNGAGWVEANAWQGTWGISHDIDKLAKLMGGQDVLAEKLNYAFEQAEPSDFVFAYNDGYVSYANQPGCSNAHVFNYAGKPWLTQYWVRKVKEQAYGGVTPDKGYGGHDEDQGQMGGTSALMAIGLFSLQGNTSIDPTYDITSPIFDEITIKLDPKYYKGKQFVIKTHNNSKQNCYIQRATLNGKELKTFWFTHDDYAKGGTLEVWLGPEPNKNWGVAGLPSGV